MLWWTPTWKYQQKNINLFHDLCWDLVDANDEQKSEPWLNKEKENVNVTWAHLCCASTPSPPTLLCDRAILKPTSPLMLAQGGSHELNTNWELWRFECEFWERCLNGVCPWVQPHEEWTKGCVCACPQVDGFNPHTLSVMWPWLNFHYTALWPHNEFGAPALSGICTTAPLCKGI